MAQPKTQTPQQELLVLDSAPAGIDKIPAGTPLTRLNYYDGLFLRASHMGAEQRYVRALAGFANQGLGAGPVHGFSTELESGGDQLALRAGLAFDSQGRTLFLPIDVKVDVQELIDKSSAAPASGGAAGGLLLGDFGDCTVAAVGGGTSVSVAEGSLYVISICHLEALCGQEDVYGRLCEKACATDVERPWRVEGVLLRALPLPLTTPFPQSLQVALSDERFLRSNVAHSFFEDERLRRPHLISAAGLRSHAWCLGAGIDACPCVPLAVIARGGGKTLFLDPWIVRRERMETPARRYWDWRMAMRPWDVFLAQVLQFQCQLADGPGAAPPEGGPCEDERQTLDAGVRVLDATLKQIQESSPDQPPTFVTGLAELRAKFAALLQTQAGGGTTSAAHVLLDQGFAELPPAGWLPVVAGKVVQGQVRAWMGAGVDLRFCIVRPDYIGHALEEAQHLERISLTKGLDDPKQLEEVDILVPDGIATGAASGAPAQLYRALLSASANQVGAWGRGVAREQALPGGELLLALAGTALSQSAVKQVASVFKPWFAGARPQVDVAGIKADLRQNQFVRNARVNPWQVSADLDRAAGAWRVAGARFDRQGVQMRPVRLDGTSEAVIVAPSGPRFGNFWAEAHLGRDPFELAAGQSTSLRLRAVLGEMGDEDESSALSAGFSGTLAVEQRAGSSLSLHLEGEVTLGLRRIDSGQAIWMALGMSPVSANCELRRVGNVTAADFTLSDKVVLRLARETLAVAPEVTYRVTLVATDPQTGGQQSVDLAELELQRDSAVAQAADADHNRAETALSVIQTAFGPQEPEFQQQAERLLFGLPSEALEQKPIVATHDWIFFHRRREKQCGAPPAAPPAPVKTRRYRLFHLSNDHRLDSIKKLLSDPGAAPGFVKTWTAVDTVEFERTSAQLLAPAPAQLVAAWQAVKPGGTLLVALMATPGVEETRALEEQRGKRVVEILTGQTEVREGDVLADVPEAVRQGFGLAADEGFMLIETIGAPAALQGHEVFLVSPEALKRLQVTVQQGVLDPQFMANAQSLVRADFTAGSDVLVAPTDLSAYVAAWNTATGGAGVLAGLNVSRKAVPAAEQQAHVKQGFLLAAKLDGSVTGVGHGAVDDLGPRVAPDVPTITLVAPKAQQLLRQQHEVFLANADQLKGAQLAVRNGTFGPNHVGPLERLGVIDFDPATVDPEPASFRAFVQAWTTLTGGAPVAAGLTVSATASDTATRAMHAKQGQFLAEKLGTTATVKAGAVATLPSSAPVLTLLMPVTPG